MKTRIIFLLLLGIVSGFEIYWNAPTIQCRANYKMDFIKLLRTYGIQVNDGDKFQGNHLTLFYEAQLGLYPRILKSGKMENGGIPQTLILCFFQTWSLNRQNSPSTFETKDPFGPFPYCCRCC